LPEGFAQNSWGGHEGDFNNTCFAYREKDNLKTRKVIFWGLTKWLRESKKFVITNSFF